MTAFNLSEWALKHRSLVAYIMIVAIVAGIFSYFRLGRSEDPSFIIKTMVVQAAWPGATIEDTLKQVTERLERKLQEVPKLDHLRSFEAVARRAGRNMLEQLRALGVADCMGDMAGDIGVASIQHRHAGEMRRSTLALGSSARYTR